VVLGAQIEGMNDSVDDRHAINHGVSSRSDRGLNRC
jgi:hypothetical protein